MWHIAKRLALGVFLIVVAAAVLLVSDWGHRQTGTKRPRKIALVRYVDAEFAEDTTRGIEAGLAEAGLQEGRDFTLKIQSAQGDMVTLNSIMDAVRTIETPEARPPLYGDGYAAQRCVEAIEEETCGRAKG